MYITFGNDLNLRLITDILQTFVLKSFEVKSLERLIITSISNVRKTMLLIKTTPDSLNQLQFLPASIELHMARTHLEGFVW